MKRLHQLLIAALALSLSLTSNAASLTDQQEYYIWLNIYEKLLGSNADGNGPSLSAFGTNAAESYVFVAEESGKSGYVLLRQKSTGCYLAASTANSWSVVFESSRSTDDRFCWKLDEGTYTYIISKKNSKYLGVDGANKGSTYVSVFYDKPKGSHSQFTAIPVSGDTWDDARAAYTSSIYTNAQGIREIDYCLVKDAQIDRSDAIDIHITANETPIQGSSTINLGSDHTWLIIDNITPSTVVSSYLKYVTINGARANNGSNCRVAIYLNGAAVIPLPTAAMTCQSTDGTFTLNAGNNSNLNEHSNTMTSFTLRRGYMATVASGTNGSGHSRVYVADHADLTVTLPTALAKRVSSVNIKQWQYVSKKGWANTSGTAGGPRLRATWFWSWSASYSSSADMEYVPCRQHLYWPSVSEVNSHTASAAFSINEPEHSEQHESSDCSCGGTISEWKAYTINSDFLAGGGRIGSPQPTDFSYLTNFCNYVDNMASRCDFTVTHAYWDLGGRDEASYADWFCNTKCKSAWTNTGRPLWLTEMEVSASWNTNKITSYDQNRKYLQVLLQKIEECPWIERYAIYPTDMWQTYMYYDANTSGTLTPAGEVYRDHRSTFAYNSSYTKTPTWWTPSVQKPSISVDYNAETRKASFVVTNPNTDMTDKLSVEVSTDGTTWQTVAEVTSRALFENSTISFDNISIPGNSISVQFRTSLTTHTGTTVTSDIYAIGSIINGNITANSKSDITGWTCVRAAQNGYTKESSGDTYFEVWNPTPDGECFDYYQDLTGLQNGVYRLQAKVFNSSNGVSGATVNGAVGLYAQSGTATWFEPATKDTDMDNADLLSISNIVVTNGQMRVGVRNIKAMTARWAGADDFAITYLGTVQEVLGKTAEQAVSDAQATFIAQLLQLGPGSYDMSYLIHNPEAVTSTEGWTASNVDLTSGESYNEQDSDPKNTYFDHWSASQQTATLSQTISHLPAGKYVVSATMRGTAQTMVVTLKASNGSTSQQYELTGVGNTGGIANRGWYNVRLNALALTDGQDLTISLTAKGTTWWSADHFQLAYTPDNYEPEPEPQPNGLTLSSTTASATLGEAFTAPTLDNPHSLPLTWTSSNEEVATVSSDGTVTLIAEGTTTITATFAGSKDYLAGEVSYTLTVEAAPPAPHELAFSTTSAAATIGEEFTAPTLDNPHSLPLTWTSSNEEVATVDSNGTVTLIAEGITTITATFEGSKEYEAGSVSYTLLVEKPDAVRGIGTSQPGANVYTLTGIQIKGVPTKAGVYIVDGKKVIVK